MFLLLLLLPCRDQTDRTAVTLNLRYFSSFTLQDLVHMASTLICRHMYSLTLIYSPCLMSLKWYFNLFSYVGSLCFAAQ